MIILYQSGSFKLNLGCRYCGDAATPLSQTWGLHKLACHFLGPFDTWLSLSISLAL